MQLMLISQEKLVFWINKDHHEFGIHLLDFNPLMSGGIGVQTYLNKSATFSRGVFLSPCQTSMLILKNF